MISFDAKTHNVTVLLRSAGNSLVAEGKCQFFAITRNIDTRHELFIIYNFCFLGTYKSTENETVVDIGFDINGTKHLDASFGYAIKRFHYGYTFAPQMHLIVNNELIAALQGFFYLSIYIYIFFLVIFFINLEKSKREHGFQ